jgi:2-aminoethylphosphonate dioxygenase
MPASTAIEATVNTLLLPEQIADFKRDGFLFAPGAFSAAEMQDVVRWVDELQRWKEVPNRHMAYYEDSRINPAERVLQRIENFVPYHTDLRELVVGMRMLGAVEALLGESAVLFKDKINLKLPGGDGYKPHQDQQAGWSVYAPLFITALLTIDEQTIENGCLELVAGQHKKGMIGREWAPLSDGETADMEFMPFPSKPGDVLYFDSFAPHRSQPNLTNTPRRVMYITYNAARHGDHRLRYYDEKRRSFPPDIERDPSKRYEYRV